MTEQRLAKLVEEYTKIVAEHGPYSHASGMFLGKHQEIEFKILARKVRDQAKKDELGELEKP